MHSLEEMTRVKEILYRVRDFHLDVYSKDKISPELEEMFVKLQKEMTAFTAEHTSYLSQGDLITEEELKSYELYLEICEDYARLIVTRARYAKGECLKAAKAQLDYLGFNVMRDYMLYSLANDALMVLDHSINRGAFLAQYEDSLRKTFGYLMQMSNPRENIIESHVDLIIRRYMENLYATEMLASYFERFFVILGEYEAPTFLTRVNADLLKLIENVQKTHGAKKAMTLFQAMNFDNYPRNAESSLQIKRHHLDLIESLKEEERCL